MSRTPRTLVVAVALTLCGTGGLAACSDDDEATDTTTTTEATDTTVSTGTDTDTDAGLVAFCDPYVDVTVMMSGEPDFDALSAAIEEVDANAPEEIADQAKVMTSAVAKVIESGGQDFSPFESPEFAAAQGEVDPFVFANCEFDSKAEVTGLDFSFDGLPETMSSGRNAILFTNEGAEAHEIVIMRRNDGVTESFEELLSLPEEEAMQKVTSVGGAFAAKTGSKGVLVADFEPGDYIAICFVPSGTVATDDGMTEGTGDPHFAHGMQQEFTVS